MGTKQLAILAALWCCATPSLAFDTRDAGPSALFYIEFPLDAATRKQRELNFGFSVQGREYRGAALNFDTRILNALEAAGLGAEAKWIGGGGAVLLLLLARGKTGGGGGSTQQAAATPPSGATTPPVVEIPGGGGTGGGGTGGGGTGGGGTGGGGTGGTCNPCI